MKKLTDKEDVNSEETASSRRDFLKKAGKFAIYTPPAVMMLMKPSFAASSQKGSWMGKPDYPGNGKPGNGKPGNGKPGNGKPPKHSWIPRKF